MTGPIISNAGKKTRFTILVCATSITTLLWTTGAKAADRSLTFTVKQITHGPKHHFFGYIGQCQTIPWNADERYIVALEVGFHDRMPKPDEAAEIVLIDTRQGNHVERLDTTRAWNFQQGTMFYWHPKAAATQFFFNDRDPVTGHVYTVLYDITKRTRIREYHFQDRPVANSGVGQTGNAFLALNYGRLARLRLVTGYPGALDWSREENAPENDGIFLVDIKTGQRKLLVSYRQLADLLSGLSDTLAHTALFINHTLWNRQDDRIYFFVRGGWDGRGTHLNLPCSVKPDGNRLTLHGIHIGGHPEWADGPLLIGRAGRNQVFYDVDNQQIIGSLGNPEIFPNPEGDIALSPDGKWLVNGYSRGDTNRYTVYRLKDSSHGTTPGFSRGNYRDELRIDPAPRWNRTSDCLLVSGISPDQSRQLYVICIEENTKSNSRGRQEAFQRLPPAP